MQHAEFFNEVWCHFGGNNCNSVMFLCTWMHLSRIATFVFHYLFIVHFSFNPEKVFIIFSWEKQGCNLSVLRCMSFGCILRYFPHIIHVPALIFRTQCFRNLDWMISLHVFLNWTVNWIIVLTIDIINSMPMHVFIKH